MDIVQVREGKGPEPKNFYLEWLGVIDKILLAKVGLSRVELNDRTDYHSLYHEGYTPTQAAIEGLSNDWIGNQILNEIEDAGQDLDLFLTL